jgi:hypothetical protein
VFYVILFAGLAVLLIVAGGTVIARNRSRLDAEDAAHIGQGGHGHSDAQRRQRKAKRQQSRGNRRKRH